MCIYICVCVCVCIYIYIYIYILCTEGREEIEGREETDIRHRDMYIGGIDRGRKMERERVPETKTLTSQLGTGDCRNNMKAKLNNL